MLANKALCNLPPEILRLILKEYSAEAIRSWYCGDTKLNYN